MKMDEEDRPTNPKDNVDHGAAPDFDRRKFKMAARDDAKDKRYERIDKDDVNDGDDNDV